MGYDGIEWVPLTPYNIEMGQGTVRTSNTLQYRGYRNGVRYRDEGTI